MKWTFLSQVQGLEGLRLPYDPIDIREQIKFEDIMAEGIEIFLRGPDPTMKLTVEYYRRKYS